VDKVLFAFPQYRLEPIKFDAVADLITPHLPELLFKLLISGCSVIEVFLKDLTLDYLPKAIPCSLNLTTVSDWLLSAHLLCSSKRSLRKMFSAKSLPFCPRTPRWVEIKSCSTVLLPTRCSYLRRILQANIFLLQSGGVALQVNPFVHLSRQSTLHVLRFPGPILYALNLLGARKNGRGEGAWGSVEQLADW